MQTSILILLSGSLFFVCGTVLFLLTGERRLKQLIRSEQEKNASFARVFHQIDDLLTSVKWHTEMMLDQEAGKLNIAQQQTLNRIDTSTANAMKLIERFAKVSSSEWHKAPLDHPTAKTEGDRLDEMMELKA
ncbi:TPA: hypothetical protein DCL30_00760 [Candidatus Peribacteria bacterium]|nr:MAG: hypothetical protein A3J91_02535 [Candidatus Peribacteria bacterium RIFOXYC2_FULL_58_10]OGJ85204.1 MAG: hypothetical protein A2529_01940 [Candidatus Peribacteria bacterium RIFOXYD2_FULL_58_15]HAI98059.1 hypothetical protein [Candidatus Peribacteria bacterium]HAS33899.1 hypothetical protein [Candidatus Peribacteria bacterium]